MDHPNQSISLCCPISVVSTYHCNNASRQTYPRVVPPSDHCLYLRFHLENGVDRRGGEFLPSKRGTTSGAAGPASVGETTEASNAALHASRVASDHAAHSNCPTAARTSDMRKTLKSWVYFHEAENLLLKLDGRWNQWRWQDARWYKWTVRLCAFGHFPSPAYRTVPNRGGTDAVKP